VVRLVADLSGVLCVLALLVAFGGVWRGQQRHARLLVMLLGSLALLLAWVVSVALYARHPESPLLVRASLTALCIISVPWLAVALGIGTLRLEQAVARWRVLLATQASFSVAASAVMWIAGVDWITGIGPEPAAVLSRAGSAALAIGLVPALVALALLLVRFGSDVSTIPALMVGVVGVMACVVWIEAGILWRGYLSLSPLISPVAVSSVAALVWAAGMMQELSASRPLAPSRRLVYGAVAASLVAVYLLAARIALIWVADLAGAVPVLLPVSVFLAAAGLLVALASRRVRHWVWVSVGRYVFRSKHDYGEVWIHLTELVAAARDSKDFLQRAALFCSDVLCVPQIGIWLRDSSGRLDQAAHTVPEQLSLARADSASVAGGSSVPMPSADQSPEQLAEAVGAAAAFPMRLDGRVLGYIAVGTQVAGTELDVEDRRIMEYIAAQVTSAVALYQLAEEIADAREVESFHRLSAFVIHDLKNLVAQQSFVLENAPKFASNPAFVADALAAFQDSTDRMRGLIARLRSRQAGAEPASTACDLIDLINELVAMPQLAQRSGCAVEVVGPPAGGPCLVAADRSALAQVFSNLLVNAVESLSDRGGEVSVRVSQAGESWQVVVQDNGCGMPETYLRQHLFRPFRTTKDSGMGIGLYQCKAVVEAAGGSITIRSHEHEGTIVTVTLPAWLAPAGSDTESGESRHGKTPSADR
jgi:putative PEP-CTERM system histidine kinase